VAYQYQIQLIRQLQSQDMLSQLPDLIKNNQLPPGFDLQQIYSMRDRLADFDSNRPGGSGGLGGIGGTGGSGGAGGNSAAGGPNMLDGLSGIAGAISNVSKPMTPIDGLLKNLGGLLTSTLNGLTGVTGAAGVASGKPPGDVYKMVEDDLKGLASIKGPSEQPLVNPLNSFLNSVGPVLNTVLGLLGPLGALG